MRPITTPELLEVWELGLQHTQIDKSLSLLHAASSKNDEDLLTLTIGQRNLRLLQLREWMFGPRLLNTAICPNCEQKVEWENEVRDFTSCDNEKKPLQQFAFNWDDFKIVFRLPVISDLFLVNAHNTPEKNEQLLLHQCILQAQQNDQPCSVEEVPVYILNAVEEQMAIEDAQADIRILLTCPDCSHQWDSGFDIQHYLWAEINAWAKNLLQEIYILARHFGWRESDILTMTPQRRQLYLQMIFA